MNFKKILCYMTAGCLILGLGACTAESGRNNAANIPSASIGSTGNPTPLPSPVMSITNEQIKKQYEAQGLSVVEIRDAGDATVVYYYMPFQDSDEIIAQFDWYDRSTGERIWACGGFYAHKFDLSEQKTLTVLTSGLSATNGMQSFPELYTCTYDNDYGARAFHSLNGTYSMPIEKSFTISQDRRESLTGIHFLSESITMDFAAQPGHEQEFEIGYEFIPKINVTNTDGYSYITLYNTILSAGFITPKVGSVTSGVDYASFVSIKCDGTDTLLTLKLNDRVSRYSVNTRPSTVSGLPCAILQYDFSEGGYPAEW